MSEIIKLTSSRDPVDQLLGKLDLSRWLQREARRLVREGGRR
jgi:hypothetical protein